MVESLPPLARRPSSSKIRALTSATCPVIIPTHPLSGSHTLRVWSQEAETNLLSGSSTIAVIVLECPVQDIYSKIENSDQREIRKKAIKNSKNSHFKQALPLKTFQLQQEAGVGPVGQGLFH